MWWMAACVQGPLDLPRRLEVTVTRTDEACDPRADRDGEPVTATVTNPGAPRFATLTGQLERADEAVQWDYVVVLADFVGASTPDGATGQRTEVAALGEDTEATLEVYAALWCVGPSRSWPEAGRYEREVVVVSTDVLGGDAVEQVVRVEVMVE